jgi:uncharacterized protein YodC (DUF2158 family)
MAEFHPGDVVVLKSGSMRMLVESVDDGEVAVIWANEGQIGRDTLPAFALNKWEDRGPREERPPFRPREDRGDRPFRPRPAREDGGDGDERPARPFGGPKKFGGGAGGGKPWGAKPAGDRPFKPRTGMDGKPKSKTFFRKDE